MRYDAHDTAKAQGLAAVVARHRGIGGIQVAMASFLGWTGLAASINANVRPTGPPGALAG